MLAWSSERTFIAVKHIFKGFAKYTTKIAEYIPKIATRRKRVLLNTRWKLINTRWKLINTWPNFWKIITIFYSNKVYFCNGFLHKFKKSQFFFFIFKETGSVLDAPSMADYSRTGHWITIILGHSGQVLELWPIHITTQWPHIQIFNQFKSRRAPMRRILGCTMGLSFPWNMIEFLTSAN